MKSAINKFDYPTAATHAYKIYTPQAVDKNKNSAFKQRYKQVNRQERNNERAKVKLQQQRKKQQLRRENKRKLQAEIQNKKKQLEELEKAKNMALQAQRQAHQFARIKQEQDRIKQIEDQRKAKENEFMAQNRFISALKRMEMEKDIANKKIKQAQFRRKTAEQTQKIQRNKATRYRQAIQQAERNAIPEQKKSFKSYKQPLGRIAYNYTVDYTKTYLHNPLIIAPNNEQDNSNALKKAQQENERNKQKSQNKKILNEQYQRISIQRGEKAMQKIRLERQYEKYRMEQQANAIKYNFQRIEAGKKNQYIGVKPATLSQMEAQRKLRRQQEFEQMFFDGKAPEWFDHPATQHKIQQARLGTTEIPKRLIQLSKGNPRSNQAVISHGHYSFESDGIEDLTTVKKEDPKQIDYQQQQEKIQNYSMNPLQQYEQKRMQSNYSPKNREQLSYSESEQDSYN